MHEVNYNDVDCSGRKNWYTIVNVHVNVPVKCSTTDAFVSCFSFQMASLSLTSPFPVDDECSNCHVWFNTLTMNFNFNVNVCIRWDESSILTWWYKTLTWEDFPFGVEPDWNHGKTSGFGPQFLKLWIHGFNQWARFDWKPVCFMNRRLSQCGSN